MGPAGSRISLPLRPTVAVGDPLKARLRRIEPDGVGTSHVMIPGPDHGPLSDPVGSLDRPVGSQSVHLFHPPLFELLRQGPIGQRRFTEDHQSRRLLVEAVQNRQLSPTRFPMAQPVIHPLARIRTRGMGVPTRRLVHHQQIVVLKNNARRESRGAEVHRHRCGCLPTGGC